MRLADLEPEWLTLSDTPGSHWRGGEGVTIGEAQGIMFLCPVCFVANVGPVGTHSVLCWFRDRNVPDTEKPGPGRWSITGTGFDDLTLNPSIHLNGSKCGWHGWIINGEVT